jgi:hypothetical protein
MDEFNLIYRVLNFLREASGQDEFDDEAFTAGQFKVSAAKWAWLLGRLAKDGYIDGVVLTKSCGETIINAHGPEITIKGLEYLQENSLMRKAARLAKGIVESHIKETE